MFDVTVQLQRKGTCNVRLGLVGGLAMPALYTQVDALSWCCHQQCVWLEHVQPTLKLCSTLSSRLWGTALMVHCPPVIPRAASCELTNHLVRGSRDTPSSCKACCCLAACCCCSSCPSSSSAAAPPPTRCPLWCPLTPMPRCPPLKPAGRPQRITAGTRSGDGTCRPSQQQDCLHR